jgi:hypothetical protein
MNGTCERVENALAGIVPKMVQRPGFNEYRTVGRSGRREMKSWLYAVCLSSAASGAAVAGTQHNLDGYVVGGIFLAGGLIGLIFGGRPRTDLD